MSLVESVSKKTSDILNEANVYVKKYILNAEHQAGYIVDLTSIQISIIIAVLLVRLVIVSCLVPKSMVYHFYRSETLIPKTANIIRGIYNLFDKVEKGIKNNLFAYYFLHPLTYLSYIIIFPLDIYLRIFCTHNNPAFLLVGVLLPVLVIVLWKKALDPALTVMKYVIPKPMYNFILEYSKDGSGKIIFVALFCIMMISLAFGLFYVLQLSSWFDGIIPTYSIILLTTMIGIFLAAFLSWLEYSGNIKKYTQQEATSMHVTYTFMTLLAIYFTFIMSYRLNRKYFAYLMNTQQNF